LKALLKLHEAYVIQPDANTITEPEIADDDDFGPYFEDCIGALDGTHIPVHIPADESCPFRDHKGHLSQNVHGVCSFDLKFCYILAGWEGAAHDGRVLKDALMNGGFVVPPGRYYLGDAGYFNTDYLLCPYRGVRYHLKEHAQAKQRPANKKELFNLRHARLRNVIERIFRVLKSRFKGLNKAMAYDMDTQVKLVFALTGLHNFIRDHRMDDDEDDEDCSGDSTSDKSEASDDEIIPAALPPRFQTSTSARMDRYREEMAERLWQDYVHRSNS
jgi:hypothetical protein